MSAVGAGTQREIVGRAVRVDGAATLGRAELRARQSACGRRAATSAIADLLGPQWAGTAVGRFADGRPDWPEPVVGSISHSGDLAVAVVGASTSFRSIGIDLERIRPDRAELLSRVASPAESAAARRTGLASERGADALGTLFFSMREAVFKCVGPVARAPVPWLGYELRVDWTGQRFEAAVSCVDVDTGPTAQAITGAFSLTRERVLVIALLERGESRHAR